MLKLTLVFFSFFASFQTAYARSEFSSDFQSLSIDSHLRWIIFFFGYELSSGGFLLENYELLATAMRKCAGASTRPSAVASQEAHPWPPRASQKQRLPRGRKALFWLGRLRSEWEKRENEEILRKSRSLSCTI